MALSVSCSKFHQWAGPRPSRQKAGQPRMVRMQAEGPGETKTSSLGVVITGGSKGLGYCMTKEFLSLGDRVVICGRSSYRLTASILSLQVLYPEAEVYSIQCDVSKNEDIKKLGAFAKEKLGTVDRWINNAGEVTQKKLLSDLEASEITGVIDTNVVGSMLGSAEAIRVMQSQPRTFEPKYHILNLGFSTWGAAFSKSACTHKMTKMALKQLTESLSQELKDARIKSIGVHNLSPGMVLTDLLLKDANKVAKGFFNVLAEEPETVAEDIVPKIRALHGTNHSVDYLNPVSALIRVVTGAPQILFGGRFFNKDGTRSGTQHYKSNGVRILYQIDEDKY